MTTKRPVQRRRRRRRRTSPRFFIFIAIAVIAVLAIVAAVIIATQSRRPHVNPDPTVPAATAEVQDTQIAPAPTDFAAAVNDTSNTTEDQTALPANVQIEVADLSITPGLPAEWKNILLLGADDRMNGEGVRTDAIIVCSINTQTGQVKLSSILRDLAVNFHLTSGDAIYRINSAYAFGGPQLAMKTVNELFQLNIEDYVIVNFFGFQELAHRLGGIDIDITEAEMHSINNNVIEQARIARNCGIDDSGIPLVELKNFGPNTHLDGRQTLGYARIRKLDSDVSRAERQRVVLEALAEKLKGKDALELTSMGVSMLPYVETSMTIEEVLSVATTVLSKDLSFDKTYLPVMGTYSQETRNGESMLYDCNFSENAVYLRKWIYNQ